MLLTGCGHYQVTATAAPLPAVLPRTTAQHCESVHGLPDPTCTPGIVQTTDLNVICGTHTRTRRPSAGHIAALKRLQITEYGWRDISPGSYDEDHLVPLELGGDPNDPKNLWPQPRSGAFNAVRKDHVENWLHAQVCNGNMSIEDAQEGVAVNWEQYLPK